MYVLTICRLKGTLDAITPLINVTVLTPLFQFVCGHFTKNVYKLRSVVFTRKKIQTSICRPAICEGTTHLQVEYLAHALHRIVADVEFSERQRPLEADERRDTVVLEVKVV